MRLGRFIVRHKLLFVILFAIALAASVVMYFFVEVNYDSSQYMPDDSKLSQGIEIMYDEFDGNSIAQVMVKNLDYKKAVELKKRIENINGVDNVIWLDTMLSVAVDKALPLMNAGNAQYTADSLTEYLLIGAGVLPQPDDSDTKGKVFAALLKFASLADEIGVSLDSISGMKDQLNDYYKNGAVLMQVVFSDTDYSEITYSAIEEIRALSDDAHLLGNPAMVYNSRKTLEKQTLIALGVAAAIVLAILFLSSSSYFEPILFLAAIGVAVVLNMGTDIILPSISYMTKSIAAVLQLALTMDYSIFLLHRFKSEKEKGASPDDAMALAIKHSFSPISASSLTTVISFAAIMFMSYTIGFDMGFVLAKGVVFSILSVFFLLPPLILYSNKLIERTEHKTFRLNLKQHCTFLIKTSKFMPVIILLVVLPCIYMQSANTFVYGNSASFGGESSIIYEDRLAIEEIFGVQNQCAILLPHEYSSKELELTEKLILIDGVKSVQSLSLIESAGLEGVLPQALLGQFIGKNGNYSRIAIFLSVPEESKETTAVINEINRIAAEIIGSSDYYLVGEAPSVLEIKDVVEKDYTLISILSVIFVGIVIALTFKSLALPVILVLTIESAIWLSMSIPFLAGTPMVFIGYLVISAILLGTTIDYAILYTNNYIKARRTQNKKKALRTAVADSSKTIITSASIFTCIGFAVGAISTMPAINLFGSAIGFGGLTAMLMVLILLPQLLYILDKPIQYLTHKGRLAFDNALEPPPHVTDIQAFPFTEIDDDASEPPPYIASR